MGPNRVQSKIAQVTIMNSSELPLLDWDVKTPVDSAVELIKKPISPLDTMAMPSIAEG